jgi:hypothetical protein
MTQVLRDPDSHGNNTVMLLIIVAFSLIIYGAFVVAGYESALLTSYVPPVASLED